MTSPATRRCAADSPACGSPVDPASPVPLCDGHLALAHEWSGARDGVMDVLPSPCRACGARVGVRYPSGWVCSVCEWVVGEVPDGDLAPPRVDVVYYIRFDERIKIGTTANPRQRLARLWHDQLLAFEPGDRVVERRRHTQFARERFDRTEWFALSPDLAGHIRRLSAGVDDPWQRHARWVSEALALRG